MIDYFFRFFLLLIAGAVTINGWFMVTRGQWKDEVDGTRTREGALLKGWWFFWFQERKSLCRWYKGDKLVSMVDQIRVNRNFTALGLTMEGGALYAQEDIITPDFRSRLKEAYDVEVFIHEAVDDGRVLISLCKREATYKYPYWIRTVLAGCITCFSSLYGSLVFWTAYVYFGKEWLPTGSLQQCLLLLLTWVAYMLSLAYMNTYLYKKAN